eukprot:228442-Prymnesium_polylepis.1
MRIFLAGAWRRHNATFVKVPPQMTGKRAIEATLAYARERIRIDEPDHSLRDRLELKLARKGVKANDLVA